MSNSVVIIPALNPDETLVDYIRQLLQCGVPQIIVIDDGSDQEHQPCFQEIGRMDKVILLVHENNMGKGRSLKDALAYYDAHGMNRYYNGVITADADGQHSVADVLRISQIMSEKHTSALVLGERAFDKDVPLRSRFGNSCTRIVFRLLYRLKLRDTQSGLRGIPNRLIPVFSGLFGERYEYEMNMLMACSIHNIPIKSISIETIYIDENASSHFHVLKDSIKIYSLLLKTFLRFTAVAISSFFIDVLLFSIGVELLKGKSGYYIVRATISARVCSSIYNFLMNRNVVFNGNDKLFRTVVKYYCLCIIQMLMSAFLVTLLCKALPAIEIIWKILVDVGLFFISYHVQQKWIFTRR